MRLKPCPAHARPTLVPFDNADEVPVSARTLQTVPELIAATHVAGGSASPHDPKTLERFVPEEEGHLEDSPTS